MAGYNNIQNMSNNAVKAYNSGLVPKSKITKKYIIEFIENEDYSYFDGENFIEIDLNFLKNYPISFFKWLINEGIWKESEYHHSSKYYNYTSFYSLEKYLDSRDGEKEIKKDYQQYLSQK